MTNSEASETGTIFRIRRSRLIQVMILFACFWLFFGGLSLFIKRPELTPAEWIVSTTLVAIILTIATIGSVFLFARQHATNKGRRDSDDT